MIDSLKDWKSTVAIVPFLLIAWLLHDKSISVRDGLELLAGVGAYLAAVSGGAKK